MEIFSQEIYYQKVHGKKQEVTIFLLTYNRRTYLEMMVNSILEQTFSNFTLIIMDNLSTDDTESYIKSLQDDRILYLKRYSNFNNSDTNMRFAFKICLTPYLIVMHDDDLLEKEYLYRLLKKMKNNDFDAISTGAKIINEKGELTGDLFSMPERICFEGNQYFEYYYSQNTQTPVYPSTIYRRSFFEKYQKFITVMEAGPCNDQFLWFQIGRHGGKLLLDNENTYLYRVHSNQDSNLKIGYMDYELLDYMLTIDYYITLIENNHNKILKRVIGRYFLILEEMQDGLIDRKRVEDVFDYSIVKWCRKDAIGKSIYLLMRASCRWNIVSMVVIRLNKLRLSLTKGQLRKKNK